MHPDHNDPPLIAGPVPHPSRPALLPPPDAWDTHAHAMGVALHDHAARQAEAIEQGEVFERLLWGTDWPHPQIAAAVMPDDGHLVELFNAWTPDARHRQRILVDTPARLFGR
jgi:hypothetical protein